MFLIGASSYLESIDPTGGWRVVACILFLVSCLSLVLFLRWIIRIKDLLGLLGTIEANKQKATVEHRSNGKGKIELTLRKGAEMEGD